MIVLSDLSRVLLFPKDKNYLEGLNELHKKLLAEKGAGYPAFEYFELNQELLDYYESLRDSHTFAVFTTDIIQDHPDIRNALKKVFVRIFSARELGVVKNDPFAYQLIASLLKVAPFACIYIDDQENNVNAAKEAGMHAFVYRSNPVLIQQIKAVLVR